MKKILEVLQYGEYDFRFNTDVDARKNPESIPLITAGLSMAMATSLWGGNEVSVLAIIRSLAISDLALSVNRSEMIKFLDEASRIQALAINEAKNAFEKGGGKIVTFAPGVKPPKSKC